MSESTYDEAPQTKLVGVQVVYRHKATNTLYCAWLKLETLNGITWSPNDPPPKKDAGKGNSPVYTKAPDLTECQAVSNQEVQRSAAAGAPPPPLCWWDGSKWQCGDM